MIRSYLFNALFYVATAVILIGGSPLLLGPRSWAMAGLRFHARVSLWLLRVICGTRMEVRGRENLPEGARTVVRRYLDTRLQLPVNDPGILADIDTPEDYRKHFS